MSSQAAYDQIATQYAQSQKRAGDFSWNHDLVIPKLLRVVGEVSGRVVLDAGCSEGVVARYLAEQGATVVGIDISHQLIELAQAQKSALPITYAVHDLSQPLPPLDVLADYKPVFPSPHFMHSATGCFTIQLNLGRRAIGPNGQR